MKLKIPIKPLSVNVAWQGRRFKTKEYNVYERDVLLLLPNKKPIDGEVFVKYIFYFKNYKMSDYDNPVKPIQDILVKKGIIKDDRYIRGGLIIKEPVKDKKNERIEVEIVSYQDRGQIKI